MIQQQVFILTNILMVLDAVCVIAAGYSAFFIKYNLSGGLWTMSTDIFVGSILLVMFLNNYVLGKLGLYSDRRPSSSFVLIWSILKGVAVDFVVLSTSIFLFKQVTYSREFLALFASLTLIFTVVTRLLSQLYINKISRKGFNVRKILIVGNMERGRIVSDLLESQLSWGHEVIGRLTTKKTEETITEECLGSIESLPVILRDHAIDEVVFTMDSNRAIAFQTHLETCKKMGIPVRILPALWKPDDKSLTIEECQGVPFFTIQAGRFSATGLIYKRILDLAGGVVGGIVLFLMYPFVGAAIKHESPGPVLFKQKRMGQNGRIFNLYKFRSMYQDAEQRKQELMEKNLMNGAMFKLKDDPRITRVGRWLRKTSLDEFPQFLNVLKGEMSLVGTRPPTLDEVEEYKPEHLKRISAKPGITGLWQVSGRNKITDFEEVVKLDCEYIDGWRFFDDIKIISKTVLAVLQRKGAI